MEHIFISYSHKDKEYVHKLAEALQSEGFDVWIDDRIDFGTRWPLVIETAVDHCESFILVASENSHESQWVQHELARAQRLHKQIFPLLLDGHPWISFESIQYFDVRDGTLPTQRFYDALRLSEKRRLEYFRNWIAEFWPIYRNEEYKFSINYPPHGEMKNLRNGSVQIHVPVPKGLNLEQRYIQIDFRRGNALSTPVMEAQPWMDKSSYVDILGRTFLKESGSDAGMSHAGEYLSYSTFGQSKIVSIALTLTTVELGVHEPWTVLKVDLAAEKEFFLYVVSTFAWFD